MNIIHFFHNNLVLLYPKVFEQLYLVLISTLIASIIGVPLGIWLSNKIKLKNFFLSLISTIWTIPSLALLAFLIPWFGIGIKPALITLSIYAILPIVKNTVLGIESIPAAIHEATLSLGFTSKQKLLLIDLPLALPILITGLRISVSITVGVATLAAFVGAGGLGDFINQGLALNNNTVILLGAIPAALMALILDQLIVLLQKSLANNKKLIFIPTFLFLFSILFYTYQQNTNQERVITIASKNFTESIILAELTAQAIEKNTHLHVLRKFNLGTTPICQAAILNHQIDLYPEYTGTAYMTVVKKPYTPNLDIFNIVKNYYLNQFHLIWLPPFGFNNTQIIAIRADEAKQYQINNMSDLKNENNKLVIGVPAEFVQRPDGFIVLNQAYGLEFKSIKQMDPGLLYDAVKNNKVDVINAFSTDGRIPAYHLLTLEDDKGIYPPYQAALIIRSDTLKKYPELVKALKPIFGTINNQTMQQLNYQVDVLKITPSEVAKSFINNT